MFKPVPVAIGLRYLRAKRRNGFISFISLASILGIALGVTALITTLAVMSGFQKEIRDRLGHDIADAVDIVDLFARIRAFARLTRDIAQRF